MKNSQIADLPEPEPEPKSGKNLTENVYINIPRDIWLFEDTVENIIGLRDLVPSISNSLSTILLLLSG